MSSEPTSASLLLEIGVEELPASFVAKALDAMPALLTAQLRAARLAHGAARAYGTPRRLAVMIDDVAARQTDLEEEVLGPPRSAAFEADGKTPKKAAEGFAKKHGATLADVRLVTTPKGEYAAVTRRETGRALADVLPALIESVIPQIPFARSPSVDRSTGWSSSTARA
jgi:glycyl-tRNA synthetase beta chain